MADFSFRSQMPQVSSQRANYQAKFNQENTLKFGVSNQVATNQNQPNIDIFSRSNQNFG